jgi:hypothetical protein
LKDIHHELENNYRNIFENTLLNTWQRRIFYELCGINYGLKIHEEIDYYAKLMK